MCTAFASDFNRFARFFFDWKAFAIHFDMRDASGCFAQQGHSHLPGSWSGRSITALEAIYHLFYSNDRGIESVRIQRQPQIQVQSFSREFEPEKFGGGIEGASMRVEIQHWKVGAVEERLVGCASWMVAQRGVVRIISAPNAVPDVRVGICVACKGVSLPFVPSHCRIGARQRPDERLIQRWPAGSQFQGADIRSAYSSHVRTIAHLR